MFNLSDVLTSDDFAAVNLRSYELFLFLIPSMLSMRFFSTFFSAVVTVSFNCLKAVVRELRASS